MFTVVVVFPAQFDVGRFIRDHLLVSCFRNVPPRRLDVVRLVRQNYRGCQHVPIVDVGGYMRANLAEHSPAEKAVMINVDDGLVAIGIHSIGLEILMQNFSVWVKNQLELSSMRLELHFPNLVVQINTRLGTPLHNSMSYIVEVQCLIVFYVFIKLTYEKNNKN